jgi:hypothetical protein
MFQEFLQDYSSAVKLAMLDNLEDAYRVLGDAQMAFALVPAIHSLFTNESWRIRLELVSKFPRMGA